MTRYFKFLFGQLGNMRMNNYILMAVSLVVQAVILATTPLSWISILTFIGTFLGTTCVIAINAAKSVNGILGLLSGICFIIIGFHAKNYLSICEQIAYMATLDLPVLINSNWNHGMVKKIRKFTPKLWCVAIAFTLVVMVGSEMIISAKTNDPRPWFDAISFSISLTGGLVCFLRFNNQYFWWMAGSIFQIALWFITWRQGGANAGMLVNYFIYFANDILAFTISPWFNQRTRKDVIAKEAEQSK